MSVAFAPDYATTGRFYVYLTAQAPAGEIQIREYRRSAMDMNVADPSQRPVAAGDPAQPRLVNHNGGQLQIGPDGKLWLATGDGGGSQQPVRSLRPTFVVDARQAAATQSGRRGRWKCSSVGLRNPWRFSFMPDGQIVIADVGQNQYEEVNVGVAANYGWPCREGLHDFRSDPGCNGVDTHDPVLEKTHSGDGFCRSPAAMSSAIPGCRRCSAGTSTATSATARCVPSYCRQGPATLPSA